MALQIWLPLNGDLHNQGLSNLTFTNTNSSTIIIDSNGKIGQCYKRAVAKSGGYIVSNTNILFDKDISICCWAKVINTVGDTANGLVSIHSHEDKTGFALCIKQLSTTDYRICCSTGNGTNRTYHTYYGVTNIKDSWHHLTLTYNNTLHEFKLWVDGICEKTQNYTNAARADIIKIFDWSTTNNGAGYQPACSLNDVRIYDHVLSDKEVEEIAKGLVLHYPLNQGNPNLITENSYQQTPWKEAIKSWQTYEGKYCMLVNPGTLYKNAINNNIFPGLIFEENTQYTISLDTRDDYRTDGKSTAIRIGFHYTDGTEVSYNLGGPQIWTHKVYTSEVNKTIEYIRGSYGNSGFTYIANLKVEKGTIATPFNYNNSNIIYDSSGYGNNGTIIGSLTTITNTTRYNYATYFDGNTACIRVPYNEINPSGIFTLNLWFYKDSLGSKNYETLFGGPSGFEMDTRSGSSTTLSLYMASTRGGNAYSPFNFNEWIMITMVRDGTNESYYVNGDLKKVIEAKSMPIGDYFIGAWQTAVKQNYKGNISDFRIYATALTEVQVKELYNTSMIIENNTIKPRDLE